MDSSARAVRDWRTRHLLIFYYPAGATEAQGPTAVLPGSCYYQAAEAGSELGGGSDADDDPDFNVVFNARSAQTISCE